MDWADGYISLCVFYLQWQVSLFEGCECDVDMWIWEVWFFCCFFFFLLLHVWKWKFGKMAEMIRMWGNQNEWCVEFANVFVIGINNGSKYFSERIFFKSVMMDYESMLQAQSSSAFTWCRPYYDLDSVLDFSLRLYFSYFGIEDFYWDNYINNFE